MEYNLEFDGTTVLCRVCGDKASGFHYGVHSCEGCKGFFRRSIQQKIQYRPCTKNQQCSILRINRNRCQYCRLKKCIAVGMSRDAVRFGRVPKREKAKILAAMQKVNQSSQEKQLQEQLVDDNRMLTSIFEAHADTCEFTNAKMASIFQRAELNPIYADCPSQMSCPLNPLHGGSHASSTSPDGDSFSPAIRGVVQFARRLPGFSSLCSEDQVTLLKAGVFEALLVRLALLFRSSDRMCCLNGKLLRRSDVVDNSPNGRFLFECVFEFGDRINSLSLSDHEIALFCALVLVAPDRPGLRNVDLVQKIHSKLDQLLQKQISLGHPNEPTLFDELKKKIPDLRTLNTLHSEKLLAIKLDAQCGAEQGEPVVSTSSASSSSSCVDQQWSDFGSPRSVASSCDGDGKLTSHSLDLNPYSPSDQMAQFHLSSSAQSGLNATTTITTTSNPINMSQNMKGPSSPRRTPSSMSNSSTCSANSTSKAGLRFGSLSVGSSSMCPVSNQGFYPQHTIQFGSLYSPMGPVSTVSASASASGAVHSSEDDKTPLLLRRVDSPTDSGIESGKEGNSATSVCSSPRSDSEEARSQPMVVSTSRATSPSTAPSGAPLDDMPMLKRALQAPPLLQTTNNLLMDQAYRHHKKFRATKLQQQQQMKREQQAAENAMHVVDNSPISSNMLLSPSSSSSSHTAPSALAAALQCPIESIGSSDQHSLARTHSTLVRTLQQQPRFANEQQLKRTDLIHNIIMRSELSASPLMSNPEMSVGLHQLLGVNSPSKYQSAYGACPVSNGSMSSAPSPLMRFQPQLPSPAGSLVNAHSPPPFSSILHHSSLDMQPLNLSKKPSAPITPPISPNAIKLEHGL